VQEPVRSEQRNGGLISGHLFVCVLISNSFLNERSFAIVTYLNTVGASVLQGRKIFSFEGKIRLKETT
jgi:hypothetical protein